MFNDTFITFVSFFFFVSSSASSSNVNLMTSTVMTLAAILIIATLAVYGFFKEMRTVHGKCEILFLIGVFMWFTALPFLRPETSVGLNWIAAYFNTMGCTLSFLWMSVMCFDVWWSLRCVTNNINNKFNFTIFHLRKLQATDGAERFKYYCYAVFGFVTVMGMMIFGNFHESDFVIVTIYFIFFILMAMLLFVVVFDGIFLVLIGVKVFQMSKASDFNDNSWFEKEKERYWTVLQVFAIMFIVWPMKLISNIALNNFESKIVSDVVVLFSACLLFIIFGMRKHVRDRLFTRYGILGDS